MVATWLEKRTPQDTILRQKDVEEKLTQQGAIPVGDSPEHFGAYIAAEMKKWGAVVKSAHIKVD